MKVEEETHEAAASHYSPMAEREKKSGDHRIKGSRMRINSGRVRMTGRGATDPGSGRIRVLKPTKMLGRADLENTLTGHMWK